MVDLHDVAVFGHERHGGNHAARGRHHRDTRDRDDVHAGMECRAPRDRVKAIAIVGRVVAGLDRHRGRDGLARQAIVHQEGIEHAELVAAIVEDAPDLAEHLVELGHRQVAAGRGRRAALPGLLVEAEFLALDAGRLGEAFAERIEAQDSRLQLTHPHGERVEVFLHLGFRALLVVLVQSGEERAQVGIAQIDGEFHGDHVGRHGEEEPGKQDAERDQRWVSCRRESCASMRSANASPSRPASSACSGAIEVLHPSGSPKRAGYAPLTERSLLSARRPGLLRQPFDNSRPDCSRGCAALRENPLIQNGNGIRSLLQYELKFK